MSQLLILGGKGRSAVRWRARRVPEHPHAALGRAECDITDARAVGARGCRKQHRCELCGVDGRRPGGEGGGRRSSHQCDGSKECTAACAQAGIHLSTDYVR